MSLKSSTLTGTHQKNVNMLQPNYQMCHIRTQSKYTYCSQAYQQTVPYEN